MRKKTCAHLFTDVKFTKGFTAIEVRGTYHIAVMGLLAQCKLHYKPSDVPQNKGRDEVPVNYVAQAPNAPAREIMEL